MKTDRRAAGLAEEEIEAYHRDGYVLVRGALRGGDTERVREEFERLCGLDHPGRVFEKDGATVRGIHGSHLISPLFARLVRLPPLLLGAQQLLRGDVYLHQCKVNAKRALVGDVWPWHQDYVFWQRNDGMPAPRAVNVALFLDEMTEHNGPLLVLPGSHRDDATSSERRGTGTGAGGAAWASGLSADLDFALNAEQLAPLAARYGIRSVLGEPGSLLFFSPTIVHASGINMSPRDRGIALFTYNSTANALNEVPSPRPTFLASRSYEALTPTDGLLGDTNTEIEVDGARIAG